MKTAMPQVLMEIRSTITHQIEAPHMSMSPKERRETDFCLLHERDILDAASLHISISWQTNRQRMQSRQLRSPVAINILRLSVTIQKIRSSP